MENVVLIIHLLLALSLIGVVLMQRSEGGGLGMGSSGGGGGVMSGRSAATALSKVTWALAVAFICTSIFLTILAAEKSAGTSVIDRAGTPEAGAEEGTATTPALPTVEDLLPPSDGDNAPLVPRAD